MNPHLQTLLTFIQQAEHLSDEEKAALIKEIKDTDKEFTISEFKLERTEKVKRTTAILLEETIEELEQKRKAVEAQNRELEIESSLERVRTVAMSMNKPDDLLRICEILFTELHALGFEELRNAMINIYDDEKSSFLNYDYSANSGNTVTLMPYNFHPLIEKQVSITRNASDAFYEFSFAGKELKEFRKLRKNNGEQDDPKLDDCSSLHYYFYSFGTGSIGISTYKAITDEKKNVLKRFRNVFDLAYKRYVDITNAEAQAREAQVQLALERVRARTMAMQNSDELKDAAALLFQQVKALGVPALSCGYNIWKKGEKECDSWMSTQDGSGINPALKIPLTEDANFIRFNESRKRGEQFYVLEMRGERMQEHYRYLRKTIPVFREYFDNDIEAGLPLPETQIHHIANFSHGNLMFITLEPCPEFHDVFKRFAAVFEQTYTRFLDLQKAEAQARESQIQLAMERVRARTMAMQHSDELADASHLLERQVAALGIKTSGCAFHIFRENDSLEYLSTEDGVMPTFVIPRTYIWQRYYEACQRGETLIIEERAGEVCTELYEYMAAMPIVGDALQKRKAAGIPFPTYQVEHAASFKYGYLLFITFEQVPEAHEIFKRFAKVFEQTYTRFLDLQKAEAQARESQIQLALERVRARTMAMQRSDDLQDAASLLFQQVKALGTSSWICGFQIWDEDKKFLTAWKGTEVQLAKFIYPAREDATLRFYEALQRGETLYVEEIGGEAIKAHYDFMKTIPGPREALQRVTDAGIPLPTFQIFHVAYFTQGFLLFITYEQVPEMWDTFKRFAKVFEQTYTRFLDLQKAEAQAREAQIEAALEKVRSRTMGMQHSDELQSAALLLFQQIQALGARYFACGFNIWDEDRKASTAWMAREDALQPPFKTSSSEDVFLKIYEAAERGESLFVEEQGGEKLEVHYRYMASIPIFRDVMEKMSQAGLSVPTFQIIHCAFFSQGYLMFISYEPVPEVHDIFKRFAKVFEQTYTRFLDLQKAEAQARESQIEAALERVRSKTMAMHNSEDVGDTVATMFDEFVKLGIQTNRCGILILSNEPVAEVWTAKSNPGGKANLIIGKLDMTVHELLHGIYKAWKNKETFYNYTMEGNDLRNYYQALNDLEYYPTKFDMETLPSKEFHSDFYFLEGSVFAFTAVPIAEEISRVIKRFAGVFGQTYRRYLDLQRAEAQAREAQIEAALERVRSRSMGMQKSEELKEVIQVIYEQMVGLNINVDGAGFAIDFRESDDWNIWNADAYTPFPTKIHIPYFDHPVANAIIEAKKSGVELVPLKLTIEERNTLLDHVFKYAPASPEAKEVVYNTPGFAESDVLLKNVLLFIHNYAGIPYTDAENAILIRFGKVFEQTYTRFNDLKKAEAQALEAIKRASVDRVRAEIASMRTTKDLERITPVVWNELTTLGVPFIRCGVFIMDEEQEKVHTFLSTPEGKAIATLHVPFDFNLSLISNGVDHWRKGEIYKEHWDTATFIKSWTALSALSETSTASPQNEHPPENLYLHQLPFLQGMLYVGSEVPLTGDELQLSQNLADAFSTAYARYEDFNKLEATKKQVDATLNELQATQKQLIQSEKMASLGELTAGIAHEIQNPLNFVNNFSEVSSELISEMVEEVDKGNYEEVKAIADDVKQNLDKINHHGKRAGDIVKGMLQHSRSSSGVKEPTDINALADEYLRLAYHGLRAKDKSFNATMKTEFDESIGKINIVPQDIGRVLLNLYNNAFYACADRNRSAVNEQKSEKLNSYKPTVSVSTKKSGNRVLITVSDNGNGIPQNIIDKIFQPFFTTKPTGQGTGLGLSLSYDIVKAHGGELKVETKEGEGSEFIIQLPLNTSANEK